MSLTSRTLRHRLAPGGAGIVLAATTAMRAVVATAAIAVVVVMPATPALAALAPTPATGASAEASSIATPPVTTPSSADRAAGAGLELIPTLDFSPPRARAALARRATARATPPRRLRLAQGLSIAGGPSTATRIAAVSDRPAAAPTDTAAITHTTDGRADPAYPWHWLGPVALLVLALLALARRRALPSSTARGTARADAAAPGTNGSDDGVVGRPRRSGAASDRPPPAVAALALKAAATPPTSASPAAAARRAGAAASSVGGSTASGTGTTAGSKRDVIADVQPSTATPSTVASPLPATAATTRGDAPARQPADAAGSAVVSPPRVVPAAARAAPADFHSEVARLLRTALQQSPQRLDLRYKLLEVSHAAGDAAAFVENARQYASQCRGSADPAWPAIVAMGRTLAPDEPLFAADGPSPALDTGAHQPHTARHYDALMPRGLHRLLSQLREDYTRLSTHPVYLKALNDVNRRDGGRPTALVHAVQLSQAAAALGAPAGGAQVWLKREDLRPYGESQRINAFGQVLLARQLGRKLVVAGSRSGAHAEAVARAAAALGLSARLYLPAALLGAATASARLKRIRQLGAEVRAVPRQDDAGTAPAAAADRPAGKDADPRIAALHDWLDDPARCHYAAGLDAGPPPYPALVADLQSAIGLETRRQLLPRAPEGVGAAVCARAAGPAALGFLQPFLDADETALHCVEARDPATGAAAVTTGAKADPTGDEHSHGYWREHAWLRASGRVNYLVLLDETPAVTAALDAACAADGLPRDAANRLTLAHCLAVAREGRPQDVVVGLLAQPFEGFAARD